MASPRPSPLFPRDAAISFVVDWKVRSCNHSVVEPRHYATKAKTGSNGTVLERNPVGLVSLRPIGKEAFSNAY